jgi:hypothetical protein
MIARNRGPPMRIFAAHFRRFELKYALRQPMVFPSGFPSNCRTIFETIVHP